MVHTEYLNEGEIVVSEDNLLSILEENKKLRNIINKLKLRYDLSSKFQEDYWHEIISYIEELENES